MSDLAPAVPETHARLLARFGTGHPDHGRRLGSGGESVVYALDSDRVLRVLRGAPAATHPTRSQEHRHRDVPTLHEAWQEVAPVLARLSHENSRAVTQLKNLIPA